MALNTCEIPWREDISNEDMGISRNALRHNVIPSLSEALARRCFGGRGSFPVFTGRRSGCAGWFGAPDFA